MCNMSDAQPNEVGIRELRHDFRAFLERVRSGERITVTDRGTPIADIVPHTARASKLEQLIAQGRVIPASRRFTAPAFDPNEPITTDVSDELQRMRDEERML